MEVNEEGRSARKRRLIMEAAAESFLEKGYDGASMDEIATLAAVSKQTVYKHFSDKETLFAAIVLATTDQVNQVVSLITDTLANSSDLPRDLNTLARKFITALMQPQVLRLRRMIISSADRFPDLGKTWYEQGFERVLTAMTAAFKELADQGLLALDDPRMAANLFVGMLLWIPINNAMFTGNDRTPSEAELQHYADATTLAFIRLYGKTHQR